MPLLGYAELVTRLSLQVRKPEREACISSAVNRRVDTETQILFPPGVAVEDTLLGHLEFALRHEGVNLEVIEALYEVLPVEDLLVRLRSSSHGAHIRRAAFLWEWLGRPALEVPPLESGGYVDLFPKDEYVVAASPVRHPKFRVRDNAPGTADFCPVVRKSELPDGPGLEHLLAQAKNTLESLGDPELHRRAISYLYLSETRGSYAIEKESPTDKQERYLRLLQQAGAQDRVDEAWLVALQNATVKDVYSREASYRTRQNFLENTAGRITFLPPPPEELRRAMCGWEAFINNHDRCPHLLVKAACAAFGFVYLHPFMDGNGRLHRFLIHQVLAQSGPLFQGTALPISAVIEKHIPEYLAVLKAFSVPVTELWTYERGDGTPRILRSPGSRPYRFFNAARELHFLHRMLRLTVEEEIPRQIAWLLSFDQAWEILNRELDLPQKDLRSLIRMVNSEGRLSGHRRKQFAHLPEDVLDRIESVTREAWEAQHKN